MSEQTASLQEEFDERGYVILRGVVAPQIVAGVREEMATLVEAQAQRMLGAGKISDTFQGAPFERRLALLFEGHEDDAPKYFRPELHRTGLFPLFFHPRLLDLAETILGPEVRLYPNYTARPKLPLWEGTQVLWHQDGGYTEKIAGADADGDVDALRMMNVWTPLVPVNAENGCMQFIPGTHLLGVVPHERRKHYLEIAPDHLKPRLGEAVDIVMEPGDVVLFHNLLFHQGQPNNANTVRWSLDWRYQDASQPTLRKEAGHIARSAAHPQQAVQSAEDWTSRTFS